MTPLEAAIELHRAGKLEEADAAYRRVLLQDPACHPAIHFLGLVALQRGAAQQAVEHIERALQLEPGRADYHSNLGQAYAAAGRAEDAERAYRAALALEPDYAVAHSNLGASLHGRGQLREAEQSYRRAVALQPALATAQNNLGSVLHELGRYEEAIACFHRALESVPDYAEAHSNLAGAHCQFASVLIDLGRFAEAERRLHQALALKPDFPEAHYNMGVVLMEAKRPAEAGHALQRATALRPGYVDAWRALGHALDAQGKVEESVAAIERAAALKPGDFQTQFMLGLRRIPRFNPSVEAIAASRERYAEALGALRASLRLDSPRAVSDAAEAVGQSLPFMLAYQGLNDRDLQAKYGELVCTVMDAWRRQQPRHQPAPRPAGGRIRLGIVSAHFRRHSVWDVLTRGLLAHIDRGRFEIIGYNTTQHRDEETSFAESRLDRFEQGPRPLQRWLEMIEQDAPDALLYPEIGMDPVSTRLGAMRLAPVQAVLWGHPETTGLPTMGYFLSGELFEPRDAQTHYTERLRTLPGLGCTFSAIKMPPAEFDLAAHGIPQGADCVRLLSCQMAFKYLPQHDAVFPRIAAAAGNCCIVLVRLRKDDYQFARFYERLQRAFAAAGLEADKFCRIVDNQPRDRFFALMRCMDIYLDTLDFSGFTTAFQALQCGLPIVTMEGALMRGRLASGLLRRIGLEDAVAADPERYVQVAARMAREPSWRAALKAQIAARLPAVFDDTAPVRAFEGFLQETIVR
jgi:protein O-GlcNAc transferase